MTTFNDRENAFENKFAHDAETMFRIAARRNRLVGEWAASLLGLSGGAAEDYAKSIVITNLEEAGDEDIVRKLTADLASTGTDDATIRAKITEQASIALAQIQKA
jgi:hypothetical protein